MYNENKKWGFVLRGKQVIGKVFGDRQGDTVCMKPGGAVLHDGVSAGLLAVLTYTINM